MLTDYTCKPNRAGNPVWRPARGEVWGNEDQHQAAYTAWAHRNANAHPELRQYYHVPNGGRRDKVTAAKLKGQGVHAGVSDIVLPVPRGGYHGLYIELKVDGNYATPDQNDFLRDVTAQGYYACVCYGWPAAMEVTEAYIKNELATEAYMEAELMHATDGGRLMLPGRGKQ